MNRRAFIAGVVGAVPMFSGCSDPGTTIRLEPTRIRAVGTDPGDEGRVWDVTFGLAYELSGLEESDGLYGVRSHLVSDRGVELERIEHGDLAWETLPASNRESGEYDDGIDYYRATSDEQVSTSTDRFPRWIVFTVDRTQASGAWSDVSVSGVSATAPIQSSNTGAGNRTDTHENDDRTRIEVAEDDWEPVRLSQYNSFPPTDGIPNAESASEGMPIANETESSIDA